MYFKNITTIEELRAQYKALCIKLHPDKPTGDKRLFVEMQAEYEQLIKNFTNNIENSFTIEGEVELSKMIDKLINLNGLIIELCGTWLWITGNTIEHKDSLKSFGFRWAKKKVKWYWTPYKTKRKGKKTMDMEYIREKYGTKTFVNKTNLIAV